MKRNFHEYKHLEVIKIRLKRGRKEYDISIIFVMCLLRTKYEAIIDGDIIGRTYRMFLHLVSRNRIYHTCSKYSPVTGK